MGQEMQFFMFVVNCKDRPFFLFFFSFFFFFFFFFFLLFLFLSFTCFVVVVANCKKKEKNRDFVSCVTGFLVVVVVVNVVDDGMHMILPCC